MTAEQLHVMVHDDVVEESKTLDYKQGAYASGDDGKKEFLKDVTAMANTAGGLILLGVEEERDGNDKPTGKPQSITGSGIANFDDWKLRATAMLRESCDPPLNGVDMFKVEGSYTSGIVVGIRVPRSWAAPHRVRVSGQSYFYLRTSAGNAPMDSREIRQAFLLSQSVGEKMSEWRSHRVGLISTDQTPVQLVDSLRYVCHVMPFGAFTGGATFDISRAPANNLLLRWDEGLHVRRRFNFHGLLADKYGASDQSHEYIQVFRDGHVEVVISNERSVVRNFPRISGAHWEHEMVGQSIASLRMLHRMGVEPPAFVALALTGCDGHLFHEQDRPSERFPINESILLLPEVQVDDLEIEPNPLRELMSPCFDVGWQAAGRPRSEHGNQALFNWAPSWLQANIVDSRGL